MAVHFASLMKHTNAMCGYSAKPFDIQSCGTYSSRRLFATCKQHNHCNVPPV
jgi:hypothetical protein